MIFTVHTYKRGGMFIAVTVKQDDKIVGTFNLTDEAYLKLKPWFDTIKTAAETDGHQEV